MAETDDGNGSGQTIRCACRAALVWLAASGIRLREQRFAARRTPNRNSTLLRRGKCWSEPVARTDLHHWIQLLALHFVADVLLRLQTRINFGLATLRFNHAVQTDEKRAAMAVLPARVLPRTPLGKVGCSNAMDCRPVAATA
jgi:hypothetical protein